MSKVDDVMDLMTEEEREVFKAALVRKEGNSFTISASKLSSMFGQHTPYTLGKDVILKWRKTNV